MSNIKQIKEFDTSKPSIVIRQALEDVELVEQAKDQFIDMRYYNFPIYNQCAVCFAGAVMVNRFESDVVFDSPSSLKDNQKVIDALYSLNDIRSYDYSAFLDWYDIPLDTRADIYRDLSGSGLYMLEYDDQPKQFKVNMDTIATIFERHGY